MLSRLNANTHEGRKTQGTPYNVKKDNSTKGRINFAGSFYYARDFLF